MAVGLGEDYFDGTSDLARVRRHFAVARQLGVKYLRCAFSWNAIEKSPGKYDWTFWDALVSKAQSAGVQLIPYVAYTPKWAAVNEQQFWSQPPRDPALYAGFMNAIVHRYRGRIKAWEIWNEPDNHDYWQGSVAEYAQLVRQAAVQMRAADPAVVLILGGMSRGPSSFFRDLMGHEHIARYVDVVAMHAYPESWDQERLETNYRGWVSEMSAILAKEAPGVDFWINEMGYADYRYRPNEASRWGVAAFYSYEHTPEYQARMLFKAEVLSLAAPRVSLTGWYRIDDFSPQDTHFSHDEVNYHLGLLDSEGHPKPAFDALKFFHALLSHPVRDVPWTRPPHSQAIVRIFQRADGAIVVVGWLRSSLPDEITDKTGMLHDVRKEQVSVPVPCRTVRNLRTFSVEGEPTGGSAVAFEAGSLRGIPLNGGDVFVATLVCR